MESVREDADLPMRWHAGQDGQVHAKAEEKTGPARVSASLQGMVDDSYVA